MLPVSLTSIDAHADELDDRVLGVVAGTGDGAEDRDDPRLADDGGQLVFDAGADARVAVEVELAARRRTRATGRCRSGRPCRPG